METIYCETPRLVIRPVTEQDLAGLAAGYRNCGLARNRFDEGGMDTGFMTESWFRQLLERRRREAEADVSYMLHLFRKSDGAAVGYCDVTPHLREAFQYGRIGYTIHNPYWGQGYGTECATALVRIGFDMLHLHRLEAHVNLDNPASKRVLEKAGFSFECVRKGFILENGVWTDQEVWFINNHHWTPWPGLTEL